MNYIKYKINIDATYQRLSTNFYIFICMLQSLTLQHANLHESNTLKAAMNTNFTPVM